ncbi:bromodomain-containing protein [Gossypium australe]|uniref:Bromodomain-containing protein n=1 Tax=Gossypium australe TaxID=47621 RepID=A0A5B6WUA4_9ROSI|nr:bromodomain-containing protein [Gossypium australe]
MRIDIKQVRSEYTNSTRTLTKLEDQMSQLINMMGNIKRKIDTGIPSNMEDNPQREGKEHVKAIALQSGKVLSSPETTSSETIVEKSDEPQEVLLEAKDEPESKEVITPVVGTEKEITKDFVGTRFPFPSRLEEKKKWNDNEFVSFPNLSKTLNVNLPLIELVEKVPKYAKFLKEMIASVRKLSVIILRKVPQNLKNLGSFTIPIEIRSIHFNRALCNLGASINLIPLSIFEKLKLVDLKTTQIILQLADRSLACPKGVLEDVLFKVRSFIIPKNFVVLDFEEDREISILLGRPSCHF